MLWRCWLGGRKGIRPVKTEWWGASAVVCLEQGADLHTAQLMPLSLTVSCFSKIQIGFTFLVPAHLGSPGKRAVKRVCVCALLPARSLLTSTSTFHWEGASVLLNGGAYTVSVHCKINIKYAFNTFVIVSGMTLSASSLQNTVPLIPVNHKYREQLWNV